MTAPDPDAGRGGEPLDERDCPEDPLVLFGRWHRTAVAARVPEPDAMTLATVSEEGTAAARIVLLRAFGAGGFVFLTDAASRKGRELARVAHAALAFHWAALERQVRVEGEVVTLDGNASDELFAAGPRATRIALSAWTQSAPVADRAAPVAQWARAEATLANRAPPPGRPANWQGYRLVPGLLEFWQGLRSRLHDRIRYRRATNHGGAWVIDRLAP